MKNIIKIFLLVFTLASVTTTMGCQKDFTNPRFNDFTVNGAIADLNRYDHELGNVIQFKMNISDAEGLDEFQVVSGEILYTEDLEGTTDAVEYTFTVDADTYAEGDSIQLEFKAFDISNNAGIWVYQILVVQ